MGEGDENLMKKNAFLMLKIFGCLRNVQREIFKFESLRLIEDFLKKGNLTSFLNQVSYLQLVSSTAVVSQKIANHKIQRQKNYGGI